MTEDRNKTELTKDVTAGGFMGDTVEQDWTSETTTAELLFHLLAEHYKDKPADFRLSIGHHELADKTKPMGVWNLPEFQGYVTVTVGDVRRIDDGFSAAHEFWEWLTEGLERYRISQFPKSVMKRGEAGLGSTGKS